MISRKCKEELGGINKCFRIEEVRMPRMVRVNAAWAENACIVRKSPRKEKKVGIFIHK